MTAVQTQDMVTPASSTADARVGNAGDRSRHGWAIALFALIVAASVAYVINQRELGYSPAIVHEGGVEYGEAFGSVMTGALGLVLAWLRPRNPVGWLLMAAGACLALCDLGQAYGGRALAYPEQGLPFGTLALSLSAPLWIGSVFIPASLLLVRYPTGRIEGRWPRRFDRATMAGFALVYFAYATSLPSVTDQVEGHEPPLLLPTWLGGPIGGLGLVLMLGGTLLIVGDAVRRVIRSEPRQRAALLLLLITATTAALVIFAGPNEFGGSIAYCSILVAVAIGVLRYQALGIEVLVRRALLYVMLTGLVLVAFVGVTAGFAQLVPAGPTPQIIAAVLIAVGLTPARDRLQGLVDRMVYGERDDPAGTLRRLGDSMGATPSEGLLLAVVANLAEGLRLDGAQIVGPDGRTIASWGAPGEQAFPLSFATEDLGELRVGLRRGEVSLGRADRQLLDTITPLIAAVVHAVRLSDDLRNERNRVVEATEVERRRLRQELHDGLGPSLTGIGLGLEAAQGRALAEDPGTRELLARLRTEVTASLEETRRIIDALRPAPLDAADLATALRRRTAAAAESGLQVRLDVAAPMPQLPPEVEDAAFRIAEEAVTNVVRHARATSATVGVSVADGVLRVVVADDGVGGTAERVGGVGLGSMRERAHRLGGRLSIDTAQHGGGRPGTVVTAELPPPRRPVTPSASTRHSGCVEPSLRVAPTTAALTYRPRFRRPRMTIKVVVADDHPMVRYGIAAVLSGSETVELVGEAADGDELLSVVQQKDPDVVLTDLAMPNRPGLEAIRALATSRPELPVLVLTMHADDDSVFAALRAGARGYLIKGADGAELVRAIETVASGDAVYGAAVANRIVGLLAGAPRSDAFPELTEREREVLELMADGLRNHAIADRLTLSEKTVRNHVSNVLLKLQVPDRTAAAIKARDAGYGSTHPE